MNSFTPNCHNFYSASIVHFWYSIAWLLNLGTTFYQITKCSDVNSIFVFICGTGKTELWNSGVIPAIDGDYTTCLPLNHYYMLLMEIGIFLQLQDRTTVFFIELSVVVLLVKVLDLILKMWIT